MFIFSNGIMVITWMGLFVMAHLERGRRQRTQEIDELRRAMPAGPLVR
ncbi:hypothetical protein ACWEOE_15040 [Amycolatopsis sp. NPDC004368]